MSKETILQVLNKEKVSEIPWVPFAGVHAGVLTGDDAETILTNGDRLFESLKEVNKLYRPDGQPILFDLQLEAEVLGCKLRWAKYSPPAVETHPLSETKDIPCLCSIPKKTDGRFPMVIDVMKKCKQEFGDTTALYGLICGPFTLASHLRGTNIFMDMFDDPQYVIDLVNYCGEVGKAVADYYIEAGMDVIAVVDPLVSQISEEHFEEFMFDAFKSIFKHVKDKGVYTSFFVCGDATANIEIMCKTEPDCISVDENVDMVVAKEVTDKYNVVISGNIPLTTVMLHGNQQDNMKYVVDLIDRLGNKDNLIIAPGCDMPYDIPLENTIAALQAIKETDSVREMIKNYEAVEEDIDILIPDYESLAKPLIEVFTLDSATCAACTYMMATANDAKAHFGDTIDVVEYKFTIKENIARVKKMGIKNLPSICINGELKYSSIIPSNEVFFKEIEKHIK